MSIPGQIQLSQASGRTVSMTGQRADEAVIIFDDGKFVLLGVDQEDFNSTPTLNNKRATLDEHGQDLVNLGLYTQAQLNQAIAARDAAEAAQIEARRFALYQKLKEIYDPPA